MKGNQSCKTTKLIQVWTEINERINERNVIVSSKKIQYINIIHALGERAIYSFYFLIH